MNVLPFSERDLETLALFAQRLNARRETGSTFCCAEAGDILRDFRQTADCGFAVWAGDKPKGLVSCFPDVEKGNADCSLLVDAKGEAYDAVARALVSAARERLGQGMQLTFFFPAENADCRDFLQRAGARRQVNEYIMRLERRDLREPRALAAVPRPLEEGERDAFCTLHDSIFPGVYASGRDILADLGKTRSVYVIADEKGLAAYGVLKTGKTPAAEMVGVREDARRRGCGRAILCRLAAQAFGELGAERLELVVDADNRGALGLYLDTGFAVLQEDNCFIL